MKKISKNNFTIFHRDGNTVSIRYEEDVNNGKSACMSYWVEAYAKSLFTIWAMDILSGTCKEDFALLKDAIIKAYNAEGLSKSLILSSYIHTYNFWINAITGDLTRLPKDDAPYISAGALSSLSTKWVHFDKGQWVINVNFSKKDPWLVKEERRITIPARHLPKVISHQVKMKLLNDGQ